MDDGWTGAETTAVQFGDEAVHLGLTWLFSSYSQGFAITALLKSPLKKGLFNKKKQAPNTVIIKIILVRGQSYSQNRQSDLSSIL